jgi:hypothetical protein
MPVEKLTALLAGALCALREPLALTEKEIA